MFMHDEIMNTTAKMYTICYILNINGNKMQSNVGLFQMSDVETVTILNWYAEI